MLNPVFRSMLNHLVQKLGRLSSEGHLLKGRTESRSKLLDSPVRSPLYFLHGTVVKAYPSFYACKRHQHSDTIKGASRPSCKIAHTKPSVCSSAICFELAWASKPCPSPPLAISTVLGPVTTYPLLLEVCITWFPWRSIISLSSPQNLG
jgi:hypothetical protein